MSLQVGIVGLGWAGQKHTESLAGLEGVKIAAFADLAEDRLKKFAGQHGARAYTHWQQMLDAERNLDAVILASPAQVRLEPIRAIAARGLALFCEKPPALDLAAARKAAALIRKAGVLNSVGFQYRWSPLAGKMRDLIEGRPLLFARIVVAWPVFDWVRSGHAPRHLYRKDLCGGPLIEQGIHFQDALRFITRDEPVAVQGLADPGRIHPVEGRDCEETTALLLRHASGMVTSHIHNWSHQAKLLQLQIVGHKFDLTWQMEGAVRLFGAVEGQPIDETSTADPYLEEIRGFIAAVRKKDQSLIRSSYADACQTLAVCAAATRAIAGGKPIAIPASKSETA